MSETIKKTEIALKGGEFIVKQSPSKEVYSPEMITEEQTMFRDMAKDFVNTKVLPQVAAIDKHEFQRVIDLLDECGQLGILGAGVPEEYGGTGIDFITEGYLSEELGPTHSFSVAYAAHTGIGTLPIFYYGSEEMKKDLLPKLASGEMKAAYCLTEPGSGSDSLAAKTKATLTEDGKHYIIEGQKMWITNSGFADIFTVFAQVQEDDRLEGKSGFTGFLVEATRDNINLGAEEEKMGIKGSSTRQVFFEGVKVPVENVLGQIGKGHKIAFNVLNIGRLKLGIMCVGGCKVATDRSVKYANERQQFKVPISSFGAIQHKLAEQAVQTFASESAHYRTIGLVANLIDSLLAEGVDRATAKRMAAEEYAIECAILKVSGSEVLDYCVDETVQIHGGNGFSEEFPAARAYRDARINRIFEGTNEINRLLSVGMLIKKGMKGAYDLMTPIMTMSQDIKGLITNRLDFSSLTEGVEVEKAVVENLKKALLLIAGAAVQKFQNNLEKEQEIIMSLADMLLEVFTAESNMLRVEKILESKGEGGGQIYLDLMRTHLAEACERVQMSAKHAAVAFTEEKQLSALLAATATLTEYIPYNTTASRKRIAAKMIEANGYCF